MKYIHSRMSPIDFKASRQMLYSSRRIRSTYTDHVAEGYSPDFGWLKDLVSNQVESGTSNPRLSNHKIGVLASYKNEVLAVADRPTLNKQWYPPKLFEDCIINNKLIQTAIDMGCYFGSDFHRDTESVECSEAAIRITSHAFDDNLYVGDIEILDTPVGRNVYIVSKLMPLATSLRGLGEGRMMSNGIEEIIPEHYVHICSDTVSLPACPLAFTQAGISNLHPKTETLEELYNGLQSMIESGLKAHPTDSGLKALAASLSKRESGLAEQYRAHFTPSLTVENLQNHFQKPRS